MKEAEGAWLRVQVKHARSVTNCLCFQLNHAAGTLTIPSFISIPRNVTCGWYMAMANQRNLQIEEGKSQQ